MVDKLLPYLNQGADYSYPHYSPPRIFRPSYGPEMDLQNRTCSLDFNFEVHNVRFKDQFCVSWGTRKVARIPINMKWYEVPHYMKVINNEPINAGTTQNLH